MATTLGGKKAFWRYDPVEHDTYCDITDPEGETIASVKTKSDHVGSYNRVKAQWDTFKSVMTIIAEKKLVERQIRKDMWKDFRTKVLKEK